MQENNLTTKQTQKTYINPRGTETSTLDYIFYPRNFNDNIGEVEVLENLNVSDHLPVACSIRYTVEKAISNRTSREITPKMKWNKLDKEIYSDIASESITIIDIDLNSACKVDLATRKVNDILEYAATQAAPKGKKLKRRNSKLRVWTPEIQAAV